MARKEEAVKKFLLSFPVELVEVIDTRADARYATRTQYIKEAVVMRLNNELLTTQLPDYNAMRRANLKRYVQETVDYNELKDDGR